MIVSGLMTLALLTGGTTGPNLGAPVKYKLNLNLTQNIDTGDQQMASGITAVAFLALTMSDTTGGQIASIVIDSVRFDADGMLGASFTEPMVSAAAGQSLRAYIVEGKVSGPAQWSDDENPVLATVGGAAVSALFIGLAPTRQVGDTWADTNNVAAETAPNGIGNSQVIAWKVTEAKDGALVVDGTSTGSVSGSNQGGDFSGTIEGTIAVTTPAGGPSRSAKLTNSQKIELLSPGAPNIIMIGVENAVSLEMLP